MKVIGAKAPLVLLYIHRNSAERSGQSYADGGCLFFSVSVSDAVFYHSKY